MNIHHIETHTSPFGYYAQCSDCGAITPEYFPKAKDAYYALMQSIREFSNGPVEFRC